MEENLVSKLKDFLNQVFNLNLKLQLKENRFKRFARDIITKEPLNSERVEPYSRNEWLRYKNLHFCFHVFSK